MPVTTISFFNQCTIYVYTYYIGEMTHMMQFLCQIVLTPKFCKKLLHESLSILKDLWRVRIPMTQVTLHHYQSSFIGSQCKVSRLFPESLHLFATGLSMTHAETSQPGIWCPVDLSPFCESRTHPYLIFIYFIFLLVKFIMYHHDILFNSAKAPILC